MMKAICVVAFVMAMAANVMAQPLDRFFYSEYYVAVEEGMEIGAKKHAVYSYILANASTPGVDLIGLLPPDDRAMLQKTVPEDEGKQKEVIIEFVLAQIAKNNRRMGALTAIWGGKAKSLKSVVTLGK